MENTKCVGCGGERGPDRFCQSCGMPQNPQKKEGHVGLDASKFHASGSAGSAPVSGGGSSGG
jgi:hypothetical protein